MELTAIHEAGHAWAYRRAHKPLRYVTLRPRDHLTAGICRPWKPRRMDVTTMGWIASAGPAAEAIWAMRTDAAEVFDWDDYLTAAVLAGGCDDLESSAGMLDNPEIMALLREELTHDWAAIQRLADRLMNDGTVSGREAFEVLRHG